jgi:hypothetical protein
MGEFQEQHKVVIGRFSTGSTTEQVTPYYDMQKYDRVDFLFEGLVKLEASGAAGGATGIQQFTLRALQASNSTGGGASAISSATAVVGKDAATGISTAAKCREGLLVFSTVAGGAALTVNVGTVAFACAASAQATVASEGFIAAFNSTTLNPSTALTDNWQAASYASGPWVRITPKNPESTHLLRLGSTGSTLIGHGGVFQAHIGVDRQFMGDGKTHIALGVKSTINANPYTVTVIRSAINQPVTSVTYSKSLSGSTSK